MRTDGSLTSLGDPTAEQMGRLTLNPIAHLDVLGTILMFVVGFGWAKTSPDKPNKFQGPQERHSSCRNRGPAFKSGDGYCGGGSF